MTEEINTEVVATEEVVPTPVPEPTEEVATESAPELIKEEEAAILNRKISSVVYAYFQNMAEISEDDVYKLFFTDEGKNSPRLLELVNNAYTAMLRVGGDLPRGHFDSYKRAVESFNQTLVFNIESKLKANRDTLIARATEKTDNPDRISHQDIIDALSK